MDQRPVMVIGATGYVGGRLTPRLLANGWRVRAVGRSMAKLRCRPWAGHPNLELAQADVMDPGSLLAAARGCQAVFYLVNSMDSKLGDFAAGHQAAVNLAAAAAQGGLGRVIYLGGQIPLKGPISPQLASGAQVGRILQSGPVPATVLRAAMILGSGSASFELLRHLARRLPLMLTPRWVRARVQPIAISNVLGYLEGCLTEDGVLGQTLDTCGPDITSYGELFQIYARVARLSRRLMAPVPVLAPKLSSYWINLVTPVPAALARPLVQGLSDSLVCRGQRIRHLIPQRLLSAEEAVSRALQQVQQERVPSCWHDAGQAPTPKWLYCGDAAYAGGTVLDCAYRVRLEAAPETVWGLIRSLGGARGYYFGHGLWRLRGGLDRLLGGVGLGRGRRHAHQLRVGDALDFWRVLEVEQPRRLVLLAEMRLPGQAVLEFTISSLAGGGCELSQIARFLPHGRWGLAYWYSLAPFHHYLYVGMLRAMVKALGAKTLSGPQRFIPRPGFACRLETRNQASD